MLIQFFIDTRSICVIQDQRPGGCGWCKYKKELEGYGLKEEKIVAWGDILNLQAVADKSTPDTMNGCSYGMSFADSFLHVCRGHMRMRFLLIRQIDEIHMCEFSAYGQHLYRRRKV